MRRIALLLTALAALAASAEVALASGAPVVPTLGVRVAGCQTGLELAQRAADFTSSMPAIVGSSVLAMRFELEQRRGGAWRPVTVPGAARWERSEPRAAGFVFDKRVERLAEGVTYRMLVRFRWSATDGTVIKRATRRSGVCRQPDLRPDLSVAGISTEPLSDGRTRYVVQVLNGGLSALLGTLRVGVIVDGLALTPQPFFGLGIGTIAELTFEGPACRPGGTVRAVADPEDSLEEPGEADNALVLRCAGG